MFRHRTTEAPAPPDDTDVVDPHRPRSADRVDQRDTRSLDQVDQRDTRAVDQRETHSRAAWSPAQIVALVIGGAAIVFGVVALARTGLNTDHWYTPVSSVLGVEHTPVLALSEITFGVLMVLSAMGPGGRPLMGLLSAIALTFGIIVVAEAWSSSFSRWFAVSDANGWLYVTVGAIGLLSATMMPTVYTSQRRTVHERRHFGRPHTAD